MLLLPMYPQTQPPKPFSPRRTVEQITAQFSKEKDAGRLAVRLATQFFFGEQTMANNTAASLNAAKVARIKSWQSLLQKV